ncbi:hypothetical protein Ctob_005193 [Chrysochromulina tobinii]|uniref:Uncharacterized protein n=1 Tax=Chrysochromulina tobinii TaxID=1460289 RepID=A0A0M0K3B9_9EUKA|nr:hypothetical protein Ctob_005193 [Chrysochromulina tobinii]|eukprot:KOO33315.1 hypothetical protein Ctob_005193 [Chrysochromulina sp. CCMP291]
MSSQAVARRAKLAAADEAQSTLRQPAELNQLVDELQNRLKEGGKEGKVKSANEALKELVDLLVSHKYARAHGATLRDNASASAGRVPTWDSVLKCTLFCLSVSKKLLKALVEKLRLLLGKALEAGPGALRPTSELRVFLYVCQELTDRGGTEAHAAPRAPAKNDGKSAHPDCIGLLVQYAQLLSQLVGAWGSDMGVLESTGGGLEAGDDGPFALLTGFMNDVCEKELPYLRKMANQLWSATLHAILCHGANVLHEVAAFGLTPCVLERVLRELREADRVRTALVEALTAELPVADGSPSEAFAR